MDQSRRPEMNFQPHRLERYAGALATSIVESWIQSPPLHTYSALSSWLFMATEVFSKRLHANWRQESCPVNHHAHSTTPSFGKKSQMLCIYRIKMYWTTKKMSGLLQYTLYQLWWNANMINANPPLSTYIGAGERLGLSANFTDNRTTNIKV